MKQGLCLVIMLLLLPIGVSAAGNISVSSSPSGATIILDGQSTGQTTNAIIENVAAGTHTILLQRTGYQDFTQTNIQVNDNQTSTVSATLTALVSAPTISSISPSSGYNSAVIDTTISGTGFSTSTVPTVVLMKSGQTNITATSVTATTTSITCQFPLTGKTAGTWTLVVTNPDGQSAILTNGFTINDAGSTITLTSITPDNAPVNSTITITNLAGTNFLSTATMKLSRTGYNDIPGTVSSYSSTKLTGTFNLNNRAPGTYQVCVANDATNYICGLSFVINSASTTNGSVYIQSNPSGASIYLDSVYKGVTVKTIDNLPPGTYKLVLQKSGYRPWSDTITITAGKTTNEYATLSEAATDTITATTVTTIATVKTTIRYTYKTLTSWPTNTPTPASPAEPLVILGAIGMGVLILRKKL